MTKMEEVKEEIKKEVKEGKILITTMGLFVFVIALLVTDKVLISLVTGVAVITIIMSFITLFSFAYVSGKRAEIEREKEREIERKN